MGTLAAVTARRKAIPQPQHSSEEGRLQWISLLHGSITFTRPKFRQKMHLRNEKIHLRSDKCILHYTPLASRRRGLRRGRRRPVAVGLRAPVGRRGVGPVPWFLRWKMCGSKGEETSFFRLPTYRRFFPSFCHSKIAQIDQNNSFKYSGNFYRTH